jgi:hypothetical protein
MSLESIPSEHNDLRTDIDLLRRTDPIAALRTSVEWRLPGTGSIGMHTPLRHIAGYDAAAVRDIVETAAAGLGLHFTDAQIEMYQGCLADLADLLDTAIARRLRQIYQMSKRIE